MYFCYGVHYSKYDCLQCDHVLLDNNCSDQQTLLDDELGGELSMKSYRDILSSDEEEDTIWE